MQHTRLSLVSIAAGPGPRLSSLRSTLLYFSSNAACSGLRSLASFSRASITCSSASMSGALETAQTVLSVVSGGLKKLVKSTGARDCTLDAAPQACVTISLWVLPPRQPPLLLRPGPPGLPACLVAGMAAIHQWAHQIFPVSPLKAARRSAAWLVRLRSPPLDFCRHNAAKLLFPATHIPTPCPGSLLLAAGKAGWIAGTSFLILVVPLIIEMDREQQVGAAAIPLPMLSVEQPFSFAANRQ